MSTPQVSPAAGPAQPPTDPESARAWSVAARVVDPEVPVLTVEDLGVLRAVRVETTPADPTQEGAAPRRTAYVQITPTYSGCPAMDVFRDDIVAALTAAGYDEVHVDFVLEPAWTTDWMSAAGLAKLEAYGIAPPTGFAHRGPREPGTPVPLQLAVKCPRCGSLNTREQARFASTACKALYQCRDCLEPFDYFKVL